MLFVGATALLVTLTVIMIENPPGAIDTLMTLAKTPHFMQTHTEVIR